MIIRKLKTVFVALMMICFTSIVYSQVLPPSNQMGINTLFPYGALDIQGFSSSSTEKVIQILNAANRDIFSLYADGKLGLGVSPLVNLDLRGTSAEPIVAIGTTTKTASAVKGGAIRYMSGTKEIHYSDGSQWFRLEAALTRPCVVAPNNYVAGSYPNTTTTRLTGFVPSFDSHNAFDQATSVYTAPVDGLYVVSFTFSFNRNNLINSDSYILGTWNASNGQSVKCIQAYPIGGLGQGGMTCSGTLQLEAGDTLYPEIWHNLGGNKQMRVYGYTGSNPVADLAFNQLSIFAQ